jgi:nicotinamide phosphoribosyltransferase
LTLPKSNLSKGDNMFKVSAPFMIDFYKAGHHQQYPEGTEVIYSNFTPRSDRLSATKTGFVMHVGTRMAVRKIVDRFNETFFSRPVEEVVAEYKQLMQDSLVISDFDCQHIRALHELGKLPIKVKALPEGRLVPIKVPLFTIRNTDKRFGWVSNYLETILSCEVWPVVTAATIAFEYRKLLNGYAKATGSPIDFTLWQGHDFSFRGLNGLDAAINIGVGHLTSFFGTDTVPAIPAAKYYYPTDEFVVAGSVPATEHSVMCVGGKESEIETFRRLIKIYQSGVLSIVSDTWNFWEVVGNSNSIAAQLKDEILGRTPNVLGLAKVVFRPDSGNPADILCGKFVETADSVEDAAEILRESDEWEEGEEYGPDELSGLFRIDGKVMKVTVAPWWNRHDKRFYYIDGWQETKAVEVELTPEDKGAVECLWDIFGGTITSTGHKLLNERVGLIYGDSITLERAKEILARLEAKGFASGNVVFGIGSFTYQFTTRDTYGCAMKATWGQFNGVGQELFKDPATDSGTKKSAKGLLKIVVDESGNYKLIDQVSIQEEETGELEVIFEVGTFSNQQGFNQVRENVNKELEKF